MKKLLLTVAGSVMISVSSFAQTHSALAQNAPSPSNAGYEFKFEGTSGNNCVGQNVGAWALVTGTTWTVTDNSGQLTVAVDGTQGTTEVQTAKFYGGDCVAAPIDLSVAANQKLRIVVDASVAVPELLVVFYNSAFSQSNLGGTPNLIPLAVGANDITVTLNLTGITNLADIGGFGLVPRKAWDDATVNGTFNFTLIQVGDAVTVASTKDQIVDNSLITVYPNPANENVTVDLSALNGQDASVKVMNSLGAVVKEEVTNTNMTLTNLEKGMYLVQVTSGNKVANKKVIVQ